jgi:hypothetical protein
MSDRLVLTLCPACFDRLIKRGEARAGKLCPTHEYK